MSIFKLPTPKSTTIQIKAEDNVDARIITESLQKIANEFNSVELHLMSKKMDSKLNLMYLRGFLTKP